MQRFCEGRGAFQQRWLLPIAGSAPSGAGLIVDSHTHVFRAVSPRFPRDVHDLFPADAEALVETLLADMERAGVDRAVLVPVSPHDEYVGACLVRFPDTFAAIGAQPAGQFDVESYRRRRESVGFQGVRLFELGNPAIDDPEQLTCFPLLEELARSGDILWFYGDEDQMGLLDRILAGLPDLTVVLNHLGIWPFGLLPDEHRRPRLARYTTENLEAVQRLSRFPRVLVMLSGLYACSDERWPYEDLRWVTSTLLSRFGPDRLLLASDFPWIRREPGYGETLDAIKAHFPELAVDELERIRGLNAADLFGFR